MSALNDIMDKKEPSLCTVDGELGHFICLEAYSTVAEPHSMIEEYTLGTITYFYIVTKLPESVRRVIMCPGIKFIV